MSAKAKLKYVLFGAVFAGGFASLSLELAVMRQLSGFVGSTAVTASIIIGVLLAFMSLGYYRGSTVSIRRNRIRQVLAPDFIVIALMSVLASSYILIDLYFWAMNGLGIRSNVAQTFVYSLLLLSAAPYLFGKVTAVLSRYLHRFDRNNTGRIMAVDTVGSVLGSILTTLVLMPFVGVNHTVMLIAAAALRKCRKIRNFVSVTCALLRTISSPGCRKPVRRRRYSLSAPAALPWGLMMTSTVIPMLTSTPR